MKRFDSLFLGLFLMFMWPSVVCAWLWDKPSYGDLVEICIYQEDRELTKCQKDFNYLCDEGNTEACKKAKLVYVLIELDKACRQGQQDACALLPILRANERTVDGWNMQCVKGNQDACVQLSQYRTFMEVQLKCSQGDQFSCKKMWNIMCQNGNNDACKQGDNLSPTSPEIAQPYRDRTVECLKQYFLGQVDIATCNAIIAEDINRAEMETYRIL